jgi:hypothetical protein
MSPRLTFKRSKPKFKLPPGTCDGVRFNFVKHLAGRPDMRMFHRVTDRIKQRRWHVVLHLNEENIIPLSEMIGKLPLPYVIDHMGRVDAAKGVDGLHEFCQQAGRGHRGARRIFLSCGGPHSDRGGCYHAGRVR